MDADTGTDAGHAVHENAMEDTQADIQTQLAAPDAGDGNWHVDDEEDAESIDSDAANAGGSGVESEDDASHLRTQVLPWEKPGLDRAKQLKALRNFKSSVNSGFKKCCIRCVKTDQVSGMCVFKSTCSLSILFEQSQMDGCSFMKCPIPSWDLCMQFVDARIMAVPCSVRAHAMDKP